MSFSLTPKMLFVSSNWSKLKADNKVESSKKRKVVTYLSNYQLNFKKRESSNSDKSSTTNTNRNNRATNNEDKEEEIEKGRPEEKREILTPILSLDCEMVGVGDYGSIDRLARCSIINYHDEVILDCYIRPSPHEPITDYRTKISGIRPHHLKMAPSLEEVKNKVSSIINNRIIVGHALNNDFSVLSIDHPKHLIRDTAYFKLLCPNRPRALKLLAQEELGQIIQQDEHDSIIDAKTTLAIYKKWELRWEKLLKKKQTREKANQINKKKKL